jgi:hypothetical protein
MIDMNPESIVLVYAITSGLALAVLVGVGAQYMMWRQSRIREEARLQKCLVGAFKAPAQKAAA